MRPALALLFFLSLGFWGCSHKAPADYAPAYSAQGQIAAAVPEYAFGVFPVHSGAGLVEEFQPVMDAINREADGFTVRLETSRDYPSYDAKLRERKFNLAFGNPYQALVAEKAGYRVFSKMGDDERFRGIVIVRKDSSIKTVNDLRGKTISFPSRTAIAGTLMTKALFLKAGLNVDKDCKPVYVGSLDSVVMNVYSGLTTAGGIWPGTWDNITNEQPEIADALEIKWSTAPLGNIAVLARSDLPEAHLKTVAKVLLDLDKTAQGRMILARIYAPNFEPADSTMLDAVRGFLQEYIRLFGKLPEAEGPNQ
jgi:phosphonate transport system substrate-binding protein